MMSPLAVYCILAFLGVNFYAIVAIDDSEKVNLIFGYKNGSVSVSRTDLKNHTVVWSSIEFENEVTALARYGDQLFVSTKSLEKDEASLIFRCRFDGVKLSIQHEVDSDEFREVEPIGEYALSMVVTPQGYLFVGCTNGYLLRCPMDFSTADKCEIHSKAGRGANIVGIAHDSLNNRIFAGLNYGLIWTCSLYETHSCKTYYHSARALTTLTVAKGFVWFGAKYKYYQLEGRIYYVNRCPLVEPGKEKNIKDCEFYPEPSPLRYTFLGKRAFRSPEFSPVYSIGPVDGGVFVFTNASVHICECDCDKLEFQLNGAETSVILV